MFCTHDVKAVVTKLNAESAEEDEEEHDQRPLALSGLHVEALSHQGEICSRELRVTLVTGITVHENTTWQHVNS